MRVPRPTGIASARSAAAPGVASAGSSGSQRNPVSRSGAAGRPRLDLVFATVLLACCVVTACRKEAAPQTEPQASGGLAGSPPVDLATPELSWPDVVAPPPMIDAAPLPLLDAAAPPPELPDAASPPPPPPAPDAGNETTPPSAPPDAGVVVDATRRDTAQLDAVPDAAARPDAAPEATARPDVVPQDAARPDAIPETAARPDATPEAAAPDDGGRLPEATAVDAGTAPDAGPAGPPAAQVAGTFAGAQRNIQRCVEAEGPGELRVQARVRGSDGRVRDVTINSAYTDAAEQCARNLIATLRFPTFAGESATLDHTYAIAEMSTAADVGADASLQQQLEAEESRLRRLAKRCIVGVTGDVTVHVWIDANTRTVTLRSVEGAISAEQRTCLADVARSANVPNIPASTERAWRIQ